MTTVLSPLLHLLKLWRRRITSALKTGYAAGDFCEYDISAATKKRTPAACFKCFICNGKVHQEYSCAETLVTLMKRGHTLRHEYHDKHKPKSTEGGDYQFDCNIQSKHATISLRFIYK
jgi:hypothetical protein